MTTAALCATRRNGRYVNIQDKPFRWQRVIVAVCSIRSVGRRWLSCFRTASFADLRFLETPQRLRLRKQLEQLWGSVIPSTAATTRYLSRILSAICRWQVLPEVLVHLYNHITSCAANPNITAA